MEAGVYEFLHISLGSTKHLEVIQVAPNGYSVDYLCAVVALVKISIRPLQQNLDVNA